MRNELRKRLKGLMALVLCVGMMFGNSMMVFAAGTSYEISVSGLEVRDRSTYNSVATINAGDTVIASGGTAYIFYYVNGVKQDAYNQTVTSGAAAVKIHRIDSCSQWNISLEKSDDGTNCYMNLNARSSDEEKLGGGGRS